MTRILLMFFGLWWAWYVSISLVRHMNGLEKWQLVKLVSYSALCAILSIAVMVVFVFLF